MSIGDIIKRRRSIRKYALDKKGNPERVNETLVLEAIDMARYAPMSGGIYSLRFILVSDREKIKKIAEHAHQDFIANACYALVVCTDQEQTQKFYEDRAERYLRQQAGAAMQNILLKLVDNGLACAWIGHFYDQGIREILGIPNNIFIEAIIPIAKPSPILKLPEKRLVDLRNILYFDKWKGKGFKKKIVE